MTGSSSQGSGHRPTRPQVSPQQVSSHVDVKMAAKSKPNPKKGTLKKGQPVEKKDEKMDLKTPAGKEKQKMDVKTTETAENNVAAKSSTGRVFSQWPPHDGMFPLICFYKTGRSPSRLSSVWVFVRRERKGK